jgi:hypothetical protein
VTLAIHIWVNWPSLLKVLSRSSTYKNSQSMVPFSYSDHRLLFERINICRLLPFFEHYNWGCKCHSSVIITLWPTHTSKHDSTTKYPKPIKLTKLTRDSSCNIWEHEIVERRSTKILVIFTFFYQKCTIVNIRLD